jgi:hypothetical protein
LSISPFSTITYKSSSAIQGYNHIVLPARLDVGEGTRGEKRTATTTVRNLSFSPIRVVGAMTTCNCLAVTGLPLTVAPRQTEELTMTVFLESPKREVEEIAKVLIDDGQMQQTPVVIVGRCRLAE